MELKNSRGHFAVVETLTPRVRLVGENKRWNVELSAYTHNDYVTKENCLQSDEGYVFLEETISEHARAEHAAFGNNSCVVKHYLENAGKKVCVVLEIASVPAAADYDCYGSFSGTTSKLVWEPPPPSQANK